MCGFAGCLSVNPLNNHDSINIVKSMTSAIDHRGPDDSGEWVDVESGIALGHRRLSVLDLSPAGHQPMVSASGRFVLIYNGEIYNHIELRKELPHHSWRGHSDTETLLAAFEEWGVESAIKKAVGMFSLALWDRHVRELFLVRDRMGEKPLYYGWQGGTFLFGSELKALTCHASFQAKINRNAIQLLLQNGYIPAPHSIYEGVYKLPPGTLLRINPSERSNICLFPKAYWSFQEVVTNGKKNPYMGTEDEAVKELEKRLIEAVRIQSIADVPLGAFLSGGIDSSMIAALMQNNSNRRVKTFTIGFSENEYNEANYAKSVAQYLGTEHTEFYVSHDEALRVIPSLPSLYDEPFGDSSAIPTFLVSELSRQCVKVALSGDGGDELFGGYSRYQLISELWRKIISYPLFLRRFLASILSCGSQALLNTILSPVIRFLGLVQSRPPGYKMHLLAKGLNSREFAEFYQLLTSQWWVPPVLLDSDQMDREMFLNAEIANSSDCLESMMYTDSVRYLPDDILCKVDRAAMGVSLETRVPFLDHRVVEFANSLQINMRIKDRKGKYILKKLLSQYIPNNKIERPKQGFGIPIDHWLRGPLRDWAEDLLSPDRLGREGFFEVTAIRDRWQEHISGRYNWQDALWCVLMFQAWHSKVKEH